MKYDGQVESFQQTRDHFINHQAFHFVWYAWQGNKDFAIFGRAGVPEPHARRGPPRIMQNSTNVWHFRLFKVSFEQNSGSAKNLFKQVSHMLQYIFNHYELAAKIFAE